MSKSLKEKISILIKKFEIGKFQDVINDSLVILKKNDNDFLWNLIGLICFTVKSIKLPRYRFLVFIVACQTEAQSPTHNN